MGGAVSAGKDNDELVDNLCKANLIKRPEIERAFRLVDRAYFFPKSFEEIAYKDVAWKHCIYHISAPCIYSEVLNALEIKPGLSFLNIGSGTGYLSTLAGFLLGNNGINVGIEICPKLVDFSMKNVKTFCANILNKDNLGDTNNQMQKILKLNEIHQHKNIGDNISLSQHHSQTCCHNNMAIHDSTTIINWDPNSFISFSFPIFITADIVDVLNMINLKANCDGEEDLNSLITYDIIYCGASCIPSTEWVEKIKHLLNIDGILVIPLDDQLVKIRRTGTSDWSSETIMAASFAPLLLPRESENNCNSVILEKVQTFFTTRFPPTLYKTCKYTLRKLLWKLLNSSCIKHSFELEKEELGSEENNCEMQELIHRSCTLNWYFGRKYMLDQVIDSLPLPNSIRQNLKTI